MATGPTSMANQAKPLILSISLNLQPYYDEMYKGLNDRILAKATLQRATKAASAIRILGQTPPPSAVLITDEALSTRQFSDVWDALIA
ncbi:hypothetical protein DL769_007828 [Monosporascus sp. CRB-8-3]|nr:hypothetical protein DL769_007828 [Monosporascus sp. CRB-8-3]